MNDMMNVDAAEEITAGDKELELPDEMVKRVDEVYEAMHSCICSFAEEDVEWDMEIIGNAADAVCNILREHGYRVRFPGVVTETGSGRQHIEEYFN